MDDLDNMDILHRQGTALAQREVEPAHLPTGFDLPPV